MSLKFRFISFVAVLLLLFLNFRVANAFDFFKIELSKEFEIITFYGTRPDAPPSFHYGIDIKAKPGTPFYSPVDGMVSFKGFTPESSETLTIKCTNEYRVTILNLVSVSLKKGDTVKKGDFLGFVSNEGQGSTETPHLHLSVRDERGKYLDPLQFITFAECFEKVDSEESINFPDLAALVETAHCDLAKQTPVAQESLRFNPATCEKVTDNVHGRAKSPLSTTGALKATRKRETASKPFKSKKPERPRSPSIIEKNLKCLELKACAPKTKNIQINKKQKAKYRFAGYSSRIIIAFTLILLSFAGIISAQSLLLAMARGRLSPKGGEICARI